MKRRFLAVLVAFTAIGGAGWHQANADPLVNNFGLDPADVVYTITFDEVTVGPDVAVTDQFMDYGVSFAPGNPGMKYNPINTPLPDGTAISGNHIGNFYPEQNPFSIIFHAVFDTKTYNTAFGLSTTPDASTRFEAFFQGAFVEGFTRTTTNDLSTFYGFVDSLGFDEIRITITGAAGEENLAVIDNIQIAAPSGEIDPKPVPEPTTLLLFGGAAVWGVRQRRRAGMLTN
jgi:hypothetical protein